MIRLKTKEEIHILREGGKIAAHILATLSEDVVPGATTADLETHARRLLDTYGVTSAFYNFTPKGAKRPYPAVLCVSVNDEVVHGIPNEDPHIIQEGDIVKLDIGVVHKTLFTDHAVTIGVGTITPQCERLIITTEEALRDGILAAQPGNKVGDIGAAVMIPAIREQFGIVEELSGHGVGYGVHEEPFVPNMARAGTGPLLKPGMVIAIEPMFTLGESEIVLTKDGYTYVTKDGSIASHIEHTIAITDEGPVILTQL